MAKVVFKFIFLCLIVFSVHSEGAIKKRTFRSGLSKLKRQIELGNQKVSKVKKDIFQLEQNISSGNIRLNKFTKVLTIIDRKIFSLTSELKKEITTIKTMKVKSEKLFKLTVLQMLSDSSTDVELATRKVLLRHLKKKMISLKKVQLNLQKRKNLITTMKDQYGQIKADREELLSILNSLELSKVSLVDKYVVVTKRTDSFRMSLEKLQTRNKISKKRAKKKGSNKIANKVGMTFMPPLSHFTKLDHGKKGLSYHFKESSPLVAPANGKVVYQGRLANYGNVLMIEHGKQIKSIILGDFLSKVKKGVMVNKGDILGYSKLIQKTEGTIYFEVRVKNKVQNTVFLLDKKYLTDKNLRKI